MPPSLTEAVASSRVSLLRTVSYILLFRVESRTPCSRKSRYFFCAWGGGGQRVVGRGGGCGCVCEERAAVFAHLGDPDEDLQLVDVELLIHALGQPGPQQVHGGSVPLLKHINRTLQQNTHSGTHSTSTTTCAACQENTRRSLESNPAADITTVSLDSSAQASTFATFQDARCRCKL